MKKALVLLLTLCLVIQIIPSVAFAKQDKAYPDIQKSGYYATNKVTKKMINNARRISSGSTHIVATRKSKKITGNESFAVGWKSSKEQYIRIKLSQLFYTYNDCSKTKKGTKKQANIKDAKLRVYQYSKSDKEVFEVTAKGIGNGVGYDSGDLEIYINKGDMLIFIVDTKGVSTKETKNKTNLNLSCDLSVTEQPDSDIKTRAKKVIDETKETAKEKVTDAIKKIFKED